MGQKLSSLVFNGTRAKTKTVLEMAYKMDPKSSIIQSVSACWCILSLANPQPSPAFFGPAGRICIAVAARLKWQLQTCPLLLDPLDPFFFFQFQTFLCVSDRSKNSLQGWLRLYNGRGDVTIASRPLKYTTNSTEPNITNKNLLN